MKYTDKLNKEIEKLLADAEATRANTQKRKAKAEAEAAEAQAELDAAAAVDDDGKYRAAIEKLRLANDTADMCDKRLRSLSGSLASADKNADVVAQIDEEIKKAAKAAEKKAASLVAELYKVACEFDDAITDSNVVMNRWSADIMKSPSVQTHYDRDISEVLYLGNIIRKRLSAKQSLTELGRASMSIYDSIK